MFEINRCKIDSFYVYAFRWLKLSLGMTLFLFIDLIYGLINICKRSKVKNISNQLALVTGGGNGLGQQISIELAKNGCNVAIADIDFNAASETAKMLIEKFNVKSKAYKVDVTNFDEIQKLKTKILNDLGPVDILVNNAGLLETKSTLIEATPKETAQIINVNLTSHFWTVQTFLSGMKERNKGHIVAISSVSGLMALPSGNSYSATKYGVRGFMESLYYDLCLCDYADHIQVTTIYPYFIATNNDFVNFIEKNKLLQYLPAMTPTYIAQQIMHGILRNKYEVVIPSYYMWLAIIAKILPKRTFNYFAKKTFIVPK